MFLSAFDCKMGYTFAFCQTEIYRNSWKLSWKLVCNACEWCTFLKPDTMYCYTPCNTLKVLIPSSLFKEVQEDTISLAAASAPPSVRSRLWSHQLFSRLTLHRTTDHPSVISHTFRGSCVSEDRRFEFVSLFVQGQRKWQEDLERFILHPHPVLMCAAPSGYLCIPSCLWLHSNLVLHLLSMVTEICDFHKELVLVALLAKLCWKISLCTYCKEI